MAPGFWSTDAAGVEGGAGCPFASTFSRLGATAAAPAVVAAAAAAAEKDSWEMVVAPPAVSRTFLTKLSSDAFVVKQVGVGGPVREGCERCPTGRQRRKKGRDE